MTDVLDRPETTAYRPPPLEPLGTLRDLTRGAGPDGEPIVMQTGGIPGGYQPPVVVALGTLRDLTRGSGPDGAPVMMLTAPLLPTS